MFEKYTSRLSHAQPMLDSTRAVGDFAVDNAIRLKRLVVAVLKTIAKCWAFFKDIHFSFFTIAPIISSFTSLSFIESVLLWGICFFPILTVITFWALDSMFDMNSMDSVQRAFGSSTTRREEPLSFVTPSGGTKLRARSTGYTPMLSRMHGTPARRHRALRPIRNRRPNTW
jgi:hypothetical protein